MNLGKLGQSNTDTEMKDEQQKPQVPRMQLGGEGGGKIPALKLGGVSRDPDPQPSNESGGKPKVGFGLDLSKA